MSLFGIGKPIARKQVTYIAKSILKQLYPRHSVVDKTVNKVTI